MKKRIMIWAVLLILVLLPQAAAANEDPMYEQVIRLAFGENMPEMELLKDDTSEILSLKLQHTLDTAMNYTYEDGWMLTGTAEPGTHVGIVVYTVSDRGTPIIWYDQETLIGGSGLYQEEVPLQLLDVQHLLIVVRNERVCAGREYPILRKNEDICTQLLEYELNLYEEYGLS